MDFNIKMHFKVVFNYITRTKSDIINKTSLATSVATFVPTTSFYVQTWSPLVFLQNSRTRIPHDCSMTSCETARRSKKGVPGAFGNA